MTTCTGRFTLADGTVAACTWTHCDRRHAVEGAGPYDVLLWTDEDPGAYHAVPCEGCKLIESFMVTDGLARADPAKFCSTCDGTGWTDPPDLPLGIGSVLEYRDGHIRAVTFVDEVEGVVGTGDTPPFDGRGPTVLMAADIGPGRAWRVVRRVWPSEEERP